MVEEGCPATQGDGCRSTRGERPLPVLLAKAAGRFAAEFERRLASDDYGQLSLAHSANVLRFLGDGPRRASQLVDLCGVSKQALSQQIAHLERAGYLAVCPDSADHRARMVSLTDRGAAAQRRVEALFTEIEDDWAHTLGERDAAALRRILEKALQTV